MPKISVFCKYCGKEFIQYESCKRQYCNRECKKKDKKPKEMVCCPCGKMIVKRNPFTRYCSMTCFRKNTSSQFNQYVEPEKRTYRWINGDLTKNYEEEI
jgi:hypothetical protein